MKTRNDVVRTIAERFGDVVDASAADEVFDHLVGDGTITWRDGAGFYLPDDADLVGAYVDLLFPPQALD